ncbi:MAG: hypothetical protein M0C28_33960 [Candidatus Moduliflexus flocculans]|nr:hypothetical protein [Candidatus Moduliflexus flocculans]
MADRDRHVAPRPAGSAPLDRSPRATRHGLYRQFGWHDHRNPEKWMELFRPFPGEGQDS